MRKLILSVIFIWLLIFISCSTTSDESDTLPNLNEAQLQTTLDTFMNDTTGLLGIVCRVNRTGYEPWGDATGFPDLSGITELTWNNKFFIGSITKMFTAAIVLQMMEAGSIDLDQPIIDYLSADAADLLDKIQYGRQITVWQALSHRSGIFNYTESEKFLNEILSEPSRVYSTLEILKIVLNEGKPDFAPGESFHYSNTNFLLLGLLIQNITQESYSSVLQENILSKLRLDNTFLFYESSDAVREGIAHSYEYFEGPDRIYDIFEFSHPGWAWAIGGLISTAEDLNTFLRALTSGQLFENTSTFQQMKTLGNNDWYGLGIMVVTNSIGGLSYGHGGYFCGSRAVSFYYPGRDTVISICFTFDGTEKNINVDILLDLILDVMF